jgi:threonine dehydratase
VPSALDRSDLQDKKVLVPLCGGNIDVTVLGRVIERGLAADGRLIRLTVPVSDRPGGIAELAKAIAGMGASVKDIFHERAWLHTSVDMVVIKAVLETRGFDHNRQLIRHLRGLGYETAKLDGINETKDEKEVLEALKAPPAPAPQS